MEALGRRAVLVRKDVAADVEGAVAEAAAELGGLDVFVMCAVSPMAIPIEDLTAEDVAETMRANAAPFVLGALAAARRMERGGRVVGLPPPARTGFATRAMRRSGWRRARSRRASVSSPSRSRRAGSG